MLLSSDVTFILVKIVRFSLFNSNSKVKELKSILIKVKFIFQMQLSNGIFYLLCDCCLGIIPLVLDVLYEMHSGVKAVKSTFITCIVYFW